MKIALIRTYSKSFISKRLLVIFTAALFTFSCSDNLGDSNKGNAIYSVEVKEPIRVLEGTDLVFIVTRSTDTSNESTVSYSLSGEATYAVDYIDPNALSISFTPGQTTAEIVLETLEDDETEEEESVILTLTGATDGTIDPNSSEATGYIRDGIPSCVGPDGNVLFIDFDDIEVPGSSRLQDGYHGFIWGDWWVKDDIMRSQDEGNEPQRGWFDGIVSNPNAIYPSFGAQPRSVSVIMRNEPFVLKSFYMSALSYDELPVTLEYRDKGGNIVGEETFVVSRREKALIEPDVNIMYVYCLTTITFNQPQLGASFIIDDMTFIY
ncbi:MAG: hypothetical protein JJU13_02400 [Balneolaceae bacterium]|nr:hypothetical protein [Balneolaceae bacterium]